MESEIPSIYARFNKRVVFSDCVFCKIKRADGDFGNHLSQWCDKPGCQANRKIVAQERKNESRKFKR